MNLFINNLFTDPFYFFSWVIIIMFSVCLHEFAHAHMALKLGDDTAARLGHLSLNPLVQMGGVSLAMLLLFGIAWGAVPVSPARWNRAERAMVSFAGPAANLLLGLVFAGLATLFVVLHPESINHLSVRFLQFGCMANAVLFIFNMLPVPVFDGWSVLGLFIPAMHDLPPQLAGQISGMAMLVLFVTPAAGLIWRAGLWMAGWMLAGWSHFFGLFL